MVQFDKLVRHQADHGPKTWPAVRLLTMWRHIHQNRQSHLAGCLAHVEQTIRENAEPKRLNYLYDLHNRIETDLHRTQAVLWSTST